MTEFRRILKCAENTLPSLGATLLPFLPLIGPMLVKTVANLNMAKDGTLYTLLEFIGATDHRNVYRWPLWRITTYPVAPAYGVAHYLPTPKTLAIANILLIIGAGGAFNAILKVAGWRTRWAVILSNMHMHPILPAWLQR
ncbi:hypothetical protein KCP74_05805 [Salmonella enterica subsp. enterica]|nr:hypothetical protein KCP74_05805 [Salmonella enterica subsp. enterica]